MEEFSRIPKEELDNLTHSQLHATYRPPEMDQNKEIGEKLARLYDQSGCKIVLQPWTWTLSFMQQSVLISGIRGCDGIAKFHKAKTVVKFYRRVILLSAFDRKALTDPFAPGGGSFTGPVADQPAWLASTKDTTPPDAWAGALHTWRCDVLQKIADDFVDSRDDLPAHYTGHMRLAFEIVGYKHPDEVIRDYFGELYERLSLAHHLWPETVEQMDERLSDDIEAWKQREDRSSNCSM